MRRRNLPPIAAIAPVVAVIIAGCAPTLNESSVPTCRSADTLVLIAQSVPSATNLPCIAEFPVGWSFAGMNVETGRAEFWLSSDRAGIRAVTVSLTRRCHVSGAVEVPTEDDEAGLKRYEEPTALPPNFSGNRYYVFPGGCVTYRFRFGGGAPFALALEASDALSFVPRTQSVEQLREEQGVELCGADVPCPG